MENIKELFSHARFFDLVDQYLEQGYNVSPSQDPQEDRKNLDLLYYLLAACQKCGYYCNYLYLLERFDQIRPLARVNLNKSTLVIMLNFALESLLYC